MTGATATATRSIVGRASGQCEVIHKTPPQSLERARVAPRRCNRAFAALTLQRMLPPVLLLVGDVMATIRNAIALLARTTQRVATGRSSPRPARHVKPHARYAYKG